MKEKLIQEISNAMTDILSVEQMAQLNGVLLLPPTTACLKSFCLPSKWKDVPRQPSNITVLPSGNFSRKCLRR